jgi:hypothetical protein
MPAWTIEKTVFGVTEGGNDLVGIWNRNERRHPFLGGNFDG